jgi:hypothetical protein
MRSKLALASMLGVALIAPAALPCGAPFGNGINVDPRQDIIVVHKNGTETYVFQPRFCGSAQEFGLILPIPAQLATAPALSPAEVFTYLDSISQPAHVAVTKCGGPGNWGAGGGVSRGDAGTGTVVVSSGTVGFMDYSQLATSSLASLTAWLDNNSYPYDSLATSAFQYYVDKGWFFVAFKINQGTITGSSTCKDLGPVKLVFPSTSPVVPTRMATARSKDGSGVLSYQPGFSWRVFGITAGAEQIGFTNGEDGLYRVLTYSGLLVADDISHLDGLAVVGDRADKLTLTFNYGSTDPDVALNLAAGKDYRQIIEDVTYVQCDGSTDVSPLDAGPDVARPTDVAVFADVARPTDVAVLADIAKPVDIAVLPEVPWDLPADRTPIPTDVSPINLDALVVVSDSAVSVPEVGKADAGVVVLSDAATVANPDLAANADAAAGPPAKKPGGGGWCSFAAASGSGAGGLIPLLLSGLLLGILRRRR